MVMDFPMFFLFHEYQTLKTFCPIFIFALIILETIYDSYIISMTILGSVKNSTNLDKAELCGLIHFEMTSV